MATHPDSLYLRDVIKDSGKGDGSQILDSQALLRNLANIYGDVDELVTVTIKDGKELVSYSLESFLSKDYEIENKKIKFGFKKISISGFKVSVSYDVVVQED